MRKTLLAAIAIGAAANVSAETTDTVRVKQLTAVEVQAVRITKNAPFAVANITRNELETFSQSGQELPFLLARTPGIIAWTENGLGTGTTYMRIRGAADSRINVTLDGVPLNSPEDQCVFWANMSSYAAMMGSVQVQRGVGSSTNGDGAFGGTVSLQTRAPRLTPSGSVSLSLGGYGTMRVGADFSTGLIAKRLLIEGAYNETQTDGYVHGTDGRSGSYMGGVTWLEDNWKLSYKNIGNFEKTGQAWDGVLAGDYDGNVLWDSPVPDIVGMSYKELYKAGYGKFNPLCENVAYDWAGGLTATPYIMKDGSVWRHTTDQFWQNRSILSFAWDINSHWSLNAALHYTRGYGHYDEFKYNSKLSKYGLPVLTLSDGSTLKKSDFVRQKGLSQDFYGAQAGAAYENGRWRVVMGANVQQFKCNHFGYLTYMANDELEALYMSGGDYKYYDSDATKNDLSAYAKASLTVARGLSVFADLQYRHVDYKTDGYNDKYNSDLSKNYLDIDKSYDFFNPKAGLAWSGRGHKAYASVAMSHREPERNNFTDNASYPAPKAERVLDYEAGYEYDCGRFHAGANIYYMNYRDQFVQTGALSDIGEALTTNIRSSYRMGVELTAGTNPLKWLSIDANMALSQNKIKDFDEVVFDANDTPHTIHYDNSTLAYSPSVVGNLLADFHVGGFKATWHTQLVGRQYVDNSKSKERSVPGYCVSNLRASYTFTTPSREWVVRSVELAASVNNIFNRHYAASGFVWYQYLNDNGDRLSQMAYIPAAGTTAMATITIRF